MTDNLEVETPETRQFKATKVTLTAPNGKVSKFLLWRQVNQVQFASINVNQIAVDPNEPLLQDITEPPEGFVFVGPGGYEYSQEEIEVQITAEGAEALTEALENAGVTVTKTEEAATEDE